MMSLQQQNAAKFPCHCFRRHGPQLRIPAQTGKFPGVGCQDRGSCPSAHYILMCGDQVYAVSIQHNGARCLLQHRLDHLKGAVRLAQPRSDQNGIHLGKPLQDLPNGGATQFSAFIRQRKHNGLVQLHRLNVINALRNAQKHQSRATAQAGLRCQICRARIALRAAQQQKLSEITLMGIHRPFGQDG